MTTTKSTRLSEEEVAFLQRLIGHFPEYRSESQLLHNATMLGLWMLAVGARRPGLPPFGGYAVHDLAALIQPRLLAAIDFLVQQGHLPALLSSLQALTPPTPIPPRAAPSITEHAFDPHIADDMANLGTDFMDDQRRGDDDVVEGGDCGVGAASTIPQGVGGAVARRKEAQAQGRDGLSLGARMLHCDVEPARGADCDTICAPQTAA
jgi:hypothetical protein